MCCRLSSPRVQGQVLNEPCAGCPRFPVLETWDAATSNLFPADAKRATRPPDGPLPFQPVLRYLPEPDPVGAGAAGAAFGCSPFMFESI